MAENTHLYVGLAGLGAGAIVGDYIFNGPRSIIGKLLGHHKRRHHFLPRKHHFPVDPYHGRPVFGDTSTGVGHNRPNWVIPIKTARAPFPATLPDMSGRVKIPIVDHKISRRLAEEAAAEEVANLVFTDMSFFAPPEKQAVGTSYHIRKNLLRIMRSSEAPELLLRLVEFNQKHGPEAVNRGSHLYKQQIQLAGACADLYLSDVGVEKWFSREGNAYAAEYDHENDRLAAAGAKSTIQFNIGGAYWNQ